MGKFSPKRLAGVWEKYKEECMSLAETHQWTSEQLVEVKIALDALPDQSSLRLWEEVVEPKYPRVWIHSASVALQGSELAFRQLETGQRMRPMPRFGDQYPYDLNPDCPQLACDASS